MLCARCCLGMSNSYKKYALYNHLVYTSLLFAAISIFAINWDKSLNFCSQPIYSLKTPQTCAVTGRHVDCRWVEHVVDDPDELLLSSGKYVTWVSVFGYNCLIVAIATIIFGNAQEDSVYFLYALLVEVLLYSSWAVYDMTISFSSRFPQECAQYKLGNNLMWVIVRFFSVYHFVFLIFVLINFRWLWQQHFVQHVQCARDDAGLVEQQNFTQNEVSEKNGNEGTLPCRASTRI